jgi:hypothetical protein
MSDQIAALFDALNCLQLKTGNLTHSVRKPEFARDDGLFHGAS